MQAIFNFLWNGVVLLLNLILPHSVGFPPEVAESISAVVSRAKIWGIIIPFDTVFRVLSLYLVFEVSWFSFKFIRWLIPIASRIMSGIISGVSAFGGLIGNLGSYIAGLFL